MKNMDDIMQDYVKSVTSNKDKDLARIRSCTPPERNTNASLKIASSFIILFIICTAIFASAKPKIINLSNVVIVSVEKNEKPSSMGEMQTSGSNKYDIESYLQDETFANFAEEVMIPKMDNFSADVALLNYKNKQIGVKINVHDFIILPGIKDIDAYYINNKYIISELESYSQLENIIEYNGYDIAYTLNSEDCYLYYESENKYCCMQIKLINFNKETNIIEILDIIFN